MITGPNKKGRIVKIGDKEYEDVLGFFSRYHYVPPYYEPGSHKVRVPNACVNNEKQDKIEKIIADAEADKTSEQAQLRDEDKTVSEAEETKEQQEEKTM